MSNYEFFNWKNHAGHEIGVAWFDTEAIVRIVCHDCKDTVEVWQYVEEGE